MKKLFLILILISFSTSMLLAQNIVHAKVEEKEVELNPRKSNKHRIGASSGPVLLATDIYFQGGVNYSYFPFPYLELEAQLRILAPGASIKIHPLGYKESNVSFYAGANYGAGGILSGSTVLYFMAGGEWTRDRWNFCADLGLGRYTTTEFLEGSTQAKIKPGLSFTVEYLLGRKK